MKHILMSMGSQSKVLYSNNNATLCKFLGNVFKLLFGIPEEEDVQGNLTP